MSRSHRKNIIINGHLNISEKKCRSRANKKLRIKVKIRIKKNFETLPILKEVSEVWAFKRDGPFAWKGLTKKR
jgi:hypothetical protein